MIFSEFLVVKNLPSVKNTQQESGHKDVARLKFKIFLFIWRNYYGKKESIQEGNSGSGQQSQSLHQEQKDDDIL